MIWDQEIRPSALHMSKYEAFGVREALKWLKQLGFERVQIETDCNQVINALHSDQLISYFDVLTNDVKVLVREFFNLRFIFVRTVSRVLFFLYFSCIEP